MFLDFLSRLRVVHFFILLVVINLVAAVLQFLFPAAQSTLVVSLLVHLSQALVLVWFLVKIVRAVRSGFDELVLLVKKFRNLAPRTARSGPPDWAVDIGGHDRILKESIRLLEEQYQSLLAHTSQLENFSQVLEKQNQKINESRQRYRQTLDALEDGIFLVDDNFIIRSINRAEAAYFGATPKELVGKYCYEVFRHEASPCPDCWPRECLRDGRNRDRLRVRNTRAGREYVNIHYYPIFHEDDRRREVVVYIKDISFLTKMEEQAVRMEKMSSIGQMAAGIAHDLNNYLTGIFGVVQLLRMYSDTAPEQRDREKELKLLQRLEGQVEALNLMAGNLMVFSHPERREKFPLSLNQVIDDALVFSRYELEREQVAVVRDFADDLPLVACEKGQIQQVLINLLLNAAEAIRERKRREKTEFAGEIVVATGSVEKDAVFFAVSDNGIGIPEENREFLFDPFYSTHQSGESGRGGATGLGLFTARTIVKQHGGEITFTSRPGQGSTFKVVLPRDGGES